MRARAFAVSLVGAIAILGAERTAAAVTNFNVTNNFASSYVIGGANNPDLVLTRGQTYTFTIDALGHPFWIVSARGAAEVNQNAVTNGVTGNGPASGTVTFVVPTNAPNLLFYQCGFHDVMGGKLIIVSPSVPSTTPLTLAALAGLLLIAAVAVLRKRARV